MKRFGGLVSLMVAATVAACNDFTPPSLTRDYAMQLQAMPKEDYFISGIYQGCEAIPAEDPIQKRLVGFQITGNRCSVEVLTSPSGRNHQVLFHFVNSSNDDTLADSHHSWMTIGPIAMTYMPNSDSFLGVVGNRQVFIAQYQDGTFFSFTHTGYDDDGAINYGVSGTGDMVRECTFTKPSYSKDEDSCP